ncbi:MAG: UvrD-helicase domain-containing protein [Prevotella sp.]|nr:UvrD-helicase domain-containing protein [Prevotella sp.]MDY4040191.1 3'-5' exonuclease [Prevotella sp.]
MNYDWKPDESQRAVICAKTGFHLVLAPPGCGKTQILTERIRKAHVEDGVPYGEMLCLTFTNRAARGMTERIGSFIRDRDVQDVYVGNVHRFCSKFLFENAVIPAESSVIDEDDAISILARLQDEDEMQVAANPSRRHAYDEMIHLSHFMYQLAAGHPRALRLHPECVNGDDIAAIRKICEVQRMAFDARSMLDIYRGTDFYREAAKSDGYDYGMQQVIFRTLQKMRVARQYESYKLENKMIDFEDLLLLTYDSLCQDGGKQFRRYSWIQVDEVQDLNPLQLAIIDGLSTAFLPEDETDRSTTMYLGDEQQAIFSFMGAKMDTLELLKARCRDNIHHLNVNHRSPQYLLDVFNTYAAEVLRISSELLPKTDGKDQPEECTLGILYSDTLASEYVDVAARAASLFKSHPDQTTALIVNANRDADAISEALKAIRMDHFKVSGADLFTSPEVKLLLAHLNVISNEHNFIAWARILKGFGVFRTNASARSFMRSLLDRAMLPTDFLLYQDSTYIQDFIRTYDEREIVIFDTETTGLNVFEDDIVQIAAVRMRQGHVVEGSEFSVYIETDREIPLRLGDIDNPIIEERKHHRLLPPQQALRLFMDYAAGAMLLGHNADYDYHILDFNLRRYVPDVRLKDHHPCYFDSLKLIRLLEPDLKEYTLRSLLEVLRLEGENAHLADADVNATRSLIVYCRLKAQEMVRSQREFLRRPAVRSAVETLRRNYRDLYLSAVDRLYDRKQYGDDPALMREVKRVYQQLVSDRHIEPVEKLDYVFRFLTDDIIDMHQEPSLHEQLSSHMVEINTLKEADLCSSKTIHDRIFVTTVHKAKGLEFDNVIIFDAVEGRYPNYYNQQNARLAAEDARKFYVAMTRAKKRLFVSVSMTRIDYYNRPHERKITPFMGPVMHYFEG